MLSACPLSHIPSSRSNYGVLLLLVLEIHVSLNIGCHLLLGGRKIDPFIITKGLLKSYEINSFIKFSKYLKKISHNIFFFGNLLCSSAKCIPCIVHMVAKGIQRATPLRVPY